VKHKKSYELPIALIIGALLIVFVIWFGGKGPNG